MTNTTTVPIGYDPERGDILDIIPGYHRIDGRTVRTAEAIDSEREARLARIAAVYPEAAAEARMAGHPDADLRAERGISPDDVEYCDDCGRPWGDCDTTVEH